MSNLTVRNIVFENKKLTGESYSMLLRFQKAHFELRQIQQQLNSRLIETHKLIVESKKEFPPQENQSTK